MGSICGKPSNQDELNNRNKYELLKKELDEAKKDIRDRIAMHLK